MRAMYRAVWGGVLVAVLVASPLRAQTPSPFPRPGTTKPAAPEPARPAAPTQPAPALPAAPPQSEPTDAMLGGIPVYPGSEFLVSYDAGQGQRYFLYGTNTPFGDIVNYYRNVLRQRGELVYDEPPVHMFDVGRYREESMAFPPGVTVKDYTWGGSKGFLQPRRGGPPTRFATVIQIVPEPR
jgi:hypothetical protein